MKFRAHRTWLLALPMAVVAIQLLTSYAVSTIPVAETVPVVALGGRGTEHPALLSIALGHRQHHVSWWEVVPMQVLILVPGWAALSGVRWLRWFPVGVLPGVVANGVEALALGMVRNGCIVSTGQWGPWAFSAGELWVLGALLYAAVHACLALQGRRHV